MGSASRFIWSSFCKRARPCLSGPLLQASASLFIWSSSASERVPVYLVLFRRACPCLSRRLQASVRLPSERHSLGEVILLFSLHMMLAIIIYKFCFCSGLQLGIDHGFLMSIDLRFGVPGGYLISNLSISGC